MIPALIAEEAVRELNGCTEKNAGERLRDLARKAAGRRVPEEDPVFWPSGLLCLGLAGYDRAAHERNSRPEEKESAASEKVRSALTGHYRKWIAAGCPVRVIDDAMSGPALLYLYRITGDAAYRKAADSLAAFLKSAPKDPTGALVYRPHRDHDYIFADGIGMASMFLRQYGIMSGDTEAAAEADRQAGIFLQHAWDDRSGLPYHGYETAGAVKCGLVGWGRAVGWLLLGMCETEDRGLKLLFRDLCRAAGQYRKEDGLFSWLIPAQDGPADLSATAMICLAEQTALENGVLPAGDAGILLPRLQKTRETILSHADPETGEIGQTLAECRGFAEHPQIYGNYPWGQGAALAFLSSMRNGDPGQRDGAPVREDPSADPAGV